nr:aldehyde dehydrogenase family protein [Marinobacterium sedimentorum]
MQDACLVRFALHAARLCCCRTSLIIAVVPEIYDDFLARLLQASRRVTLGDAMNPDVFMGPVISASARKRIHDFTDIGLAEGTTLALDGRNPQLPEANQDGYFVGPTIFTDVTPCMGIAQEEIFGPVLNVIKVSCIDGALRMTRKHPLDNGACIFTQNSFYTEKFINEADVGMVGVNIGICAPIPICPLAASRAPWWATTRYRARMPSTSLPRARSQRFVSLTPGAPSQLQQQRPTVLYAAASPAELSFIELTGPACNNRYRPRPSACNSQAP